MRLLTAKVHALLRRREITERVRRPAIWRNELVAPGYGQVNGKRFI